jgi:hypothetical protein
MSPSKKDMAFETRKQLQHSNRVLGLERRISLNKDSFNEKLPNSQGQKETRYIPAHSATINCR